MYTYKKPLNAILLVICLTSTSSVYTASWIKSFLPKTPALNNKLNHAISDGDYAQVVDLLAHGADPTAKLDGQRSLFVHAFEQALIRNDDGIIIAVDGKQADIAAQLANYRGRLRDLERDLTRYTHKASLFLNADVVKEFNAFVDDLRKIAADPRAVKYRHK